MSPDARLPLRLPWKAWLIYTHRWLGIAGCLLFLAWFVSGIVMMYVRMPAVTQAERRAGVGSALGVELAMLGDRPVYRFSGSQAATVFADRGDLLADVGVDMALARASEWAGPAVAPRYDALLTTPDQWTLQTRQHLPLHRIALDDAADSYLYVSSRTGEVVMERTAASVSGPIGGRSRTGSTCPCFDATVRCGPR
jgi:hypothetical protein